MALMAMFLPVVEWLATLNRPKLCPDPVRHGRDPVQVPRPVPSASPISTLHRFPNPLGTTLVTSKNVLAILLQPPVKLVEFPLDSRELRPLSLPPTLKSREVLLEELEVVRSFGMTSLLPTLLISLPARVVARSTGPVDEMDPVLAARGRVVEVLPLVRTWV